jgi:hypothetical protein
MNSGNPLMEFVLWDFAVQLPIWIAYLLAIILIVTHWRNHPRPTRLAAWGLMALALDIPVLSLFNRWLDYKRYSESWSTTQFGYMVWSVTFARCLFLAIGIALLLFAVYSSRLPAAARRAERVRDLDFPFEQPKRPSAPAAPVEVAPNAGIRERKE